MPAELLESICLESGSIRVRSSVSATIIHGIPLLVFMLGYIR